MLQTCFLNHICDPNIKLIQNNYGNNMYAKRPIKTGEQVQILF